MFGVCINVASAECAVGSVFDSGYLLTDASSE